MDVYRLLDKDYQNEPDTPGGQGIKDGTSRAIRLDTVEASGSILTPLIAGTRVKSLYAFIDILTPRTTS